jgi:3-deoxy-D-manno-octulosonic-acid transferase
MERATFRLYGLGWRIAMPFLARNPRLREGFRQRILADWPSGEVDLWIQGASAGESYLAVQLLSRLEADGPRRVLATTNTRQGMEILEGFAGASPGAGDRSSVATAYFPFDHPAVMDRAVRAVSPKAVVLLESEIWPGLLYALKRRGRAVLIVNGRMTERSLKRYRIWPAIWRFLAPDRVLAVSQSDADRFSRLFGADRVSVMDNMKFDRVAVPPAGGVSRAASAIPEAVPFAVLGSVRQEEEGPAAEIVGRLVRDCPRAVIGLFPRHMERIPDWQAVLDRMEIPWRLRSATRNPVQPGTVLLWDVFGELFAAYERASAAFVGGSLAPLGGQNVLEPLMAGVRPAIGPSWENFAWVGREAVDNGLVRVRPDAAGVAATLLKDLTHPADREAIRHQAMAYVRRRQGGADRACAVIRDYLNRRKREAIP